MNTIFHKRKTQNQKLCLLRKKLFRSLAIAKVSTAAVGVSFGMLASYPVAALEKDNTAKITKSATLITNELGAIRYIVQLDDGRKVDTTTPFPRTVSKAEIESSLESVKQATEALVVNVVGSVGAKSLRTTALLMPTFLAYLDEAQVKQLIADKRVLKLEQDTYAQTSNIWNNSASGGQVNSWGVAAMGLSNPSASNGIANVFVLDTGMVPHVDLPQFTANNEWRATPAANQPPCWDHASHVAGIIGAANNGSGVVGMLPGVSIASLNVTDIVTTAFSSPCSVGVPTSGILSALERVRIQTAMSSAVGIVNMSINASPPDPNFVPVNIFSASGGLAGAAMQALAVPASVTFYVYGLGPGRPLIPVAVYSPGALVVQSAGNYNLDACLYAFNAPNPQDGIMVVGALDENGNAVRPIITGTQAFESVPSDGPYAGFVLQQAGSNHGSCVDVWAPGQRITSLWRNNGTQVLSGTSMAAPYVVGLAARLYEANPGVLNTPAKLEQAVRQQIITVGGSNLAVARYGGAINAAATIDIQAGYANPASTPSNSQPARIWRRASHGAGNFSGSLNGSSASPLQFTIGAIGAAACDYNIFDANNNLVILSQPLGNLSSNKLFAAADFGLPSSPPPQSFRTVAVSCNSPTQITNVSAQGLVLP